MRRRLRRILDFVLMPIPAAVGFFIGGLAVFFVGFFLTQTQTDLKSMIEQGYSNFGIELVSIAITVLVIDRLNQRRADRERLQELMAQMRSQNNGLTLVAAEIMELRGWLHDGSLHGANLWKADLKGANLLRASLEKANLERANLQGAFLRYAHLEGAQLVMANFEDAHLVMAYLKDAHLEDAHFERAILHGANFEEAKLIGAHFEKAKLEGANLQGANLWLAILEGAVIEGARLDRAILPDKSIWTPDRDMREFTDPEAWAAEQAAKKAADG